MENVSNQVSTLMRNQAHDQTPLQVWQQARSKVWYQVWDQVKGSAYNQVRYQVRIQVEGELWKT